MKIGITLLEASAFALSAGLALAQDAVSAPMAGMDHSSNAADPTAPGGAMDAYMAAMRSMDEAMAKMTPTSDAEADYLMMMIPHHRSAVEMSEALLPLAKDPEVKALAEAVIATQEAEIASMEAMLARLGHPVR